MNGELVSAGALSSLFLEGVKVIVRRWIVKDPAYDFPPKFYLFLIPLLNAVMPYPMFLLGLPVVDPILALGSWDTVAKYLLIVALNSLVSVLAYETTIKPVKDYREEYKFNHL